MSISQKTLLLLTLKWQLLETSVDWCTQMRKPNIKLMCLMMFIVLLPCNYIILLIASLFILIYKGWLPKPVLNAYTSGVKPSDVLPGSVEEKAAVGMELLLRSAEMPASLLKDEPETAGD